MWKNFKWNWKWKTNINKQIFSEFFNRHYPSFSVKDLYEDNQNKNEKIVKNINKSLINLRTWLTVNRFLKTEIRKKIL